MIPSMLAVILWVVVTQPAAADGRHPDRSQGPRHNCAVSASAGATVTNRDGGPSAGAEQGSAGHRVYIDPATGRPGVPPDDFQPQRRRVPRAGRGTATPELVEIRRPEPGAGVMIDLQGRFRSSLNATAGADGKIKIQHAPCDPALDPKG